MNVSFKTPSPLVLYIHGKGGSAAECEHYKPLFPRQEVIGLDYQTSTPWEAEEEIRGEVERLKKEYEDITQNMKTSLLSLTASARFFAWSQESKG